MNVLTIRNNPTHFTHYEAAGGHIGRHVATTYLAQDCLNGNVWRTRMAQAKMGAKPMDTDSLAINEHLDWIDDRLDEAELDRIEKKLG